MSDYFMVYSSASSFTRKRNQRKENLFLRAPIQKRRRTEEHSSSFNYLKFFEYLKYSGSSNVIVRLILGVRGKGSARMKSNFEINAVLAF